MNRAVEGQEEAPAGSQAPAEREALQDPIQPVGHPTEAAPAAALLPWVEGVRSPEGFGRRVARPGEKSRRERLSCPDFPDQARRLPALSSLHQP